MSIKYDYNEFLKHKHDLLLDEKEINRVSIIMGLNLKIMEIYNVKIKKIY